MAVKASFEADFSKWLDGIRAVNGSLDQLQAVVGTTDRSVDAMSKRFDGTKVIGEATKMVSAVQDIGGAARLTDSEARRVNATVTEAIEKMQRLGGTAPPEMLKLRDATSRANNELKQQPGIMENIKGAAMMAGKMLAGAFTIGAITNLVKDTLAYASAIDDTAKKLGISLEATQRYKFAAEQTGASLENVSKSVLTLSKKLAGDDKAAKEALDAMGLSFKAIREMQPDKAFNATAAAIAKLPDPMQQTKVTLDLWGKSGLELLPAIRDGFVELGDSITVMKDTTVDRLAKAEDAWQKLGVRATIVSGEIISAISGIIGAMGAIRPNMSQAEGSMTNGFSAAKVAVGDTTTTTQQFAAEMNALRNEMPGIVAKIASPFADLGLALDNTASQKEAFDKMLRDSSASIEAEKANKKYMESVSELAKKFTGDALADQVKRLGDAVIAAGGAAKMTAYEKGQLRKQIGDLQAQGAQLQPVLQKIIDKYNEMKAHAFPVVSTLDSIKIAMGAVKQIALSMPDRLIPVMKLPTFEATAKDVLAWQDGLNANLGAAAKSGAAVFADNFKDLLKTGLPQAIMAAIQGGGSVIEAAGSTIGSFLVSDKGIGKSLAAGAKDLFGNKLGGMIASALPGLGAMLGPALSGLFNKLFGSAGRDAVKEFASTFGGFDALREKLNALGAEGERLWVQLTQGTGKNNKAQAEAAIRAIQEAFARAEEEARKLREEIAGIESELADLRSRSEPTFRDMEAAAKAFGVELSRLGPAFQQQRLTDRAREIYDAFDTLRRGGADTTVILEGMADEINDLVLQSLKFGTTIPENFRPLIQSLLESGQLVDENGEKLTDLGQIRFGDAVKSQWEVIADRIKDLTDALQKLVEKLNGPLVDAARNVAREFGNLPGEIDVRLRVGRPGDAEGDELPQFATGTKGVTGRYFQNFGAGKLAMLHGNEAVVPQSQAQQFADAVGGGNGDVVAELSALRSDFVAMPRLIARAVRDAILVAG